MKFTSVLSSLPQSRIVQTRLTIFTSTTTISQSSCSGPPKLPPDSPVILVNTSRIFEHFRLASFFQFPLVFLLSVCIRYICCPGLRFCARSSGAILNAGTLIGNVLKLSLEPRALRVCPCHLGLLSVDYVNIYVYRDARRLVEDEFQHVSHEMSGVEIAASTHLPKIWTIGPSILQTQSKANQARECTFSRCKSWSIEVMLFKSHLNPHDHGLIEVDNACYWREGHTQYSRHIHGPVGEELWCSQELNFQ